VAWWGGPNREGRAETVQAWRVPIAQIQERNYNLDLKNPHSEAADHGDPEELLASLQAAEQKAAELRGQLKAILAEALLR
jgi:type I restriction enzyme M protein